MRYGRRVTPLTQAQRHARQRHMANLWLAAAVFLIAAAGYALAQVMW